MWGGGHPFLPPLLPLPLSVDQYHPYLDPHFTGRFKPKTLCIKNKNTAKRFSGARIANRQILPPPFSIVAISALFESGVNGRGMHPPAGLPAGGGGRGKGAAAPGRHNPEVGVVALRHAGRTPRRRGDGRRRLETLSAPMCGGWGLGGRVPHRNTGRRRESSLPPDELRRSLPPGGGEKRSGRPKTGAKRK